MRRAGFSLASILLLTVVVAVFAAGIASVLTRWSGANRWLLLATAGGGMLIGIAVGVAVGLRQLRPVAGVVAGVPTGAIAGAGCGLLLAAPNLLPIVVVGSAVMVVFALVVRLYSR